MHLRIARHTEQLVGTFTGHDGYSGSTEKRRVKGHWFLPGGGRETCLVTVTRIAR